MTVELFGALRHAAQIEAAAEAKIAAYIDTYLEEAVEQDDDDLLAAHDIEGPLPTIKSYSTVTEFDRFPEEQIPACVLVVAGTLGTPQDLGDDGYRATYELGVAVVCEARTQEATNLLAKLYGALTRDLLLQHAKLSPAVAVASWTGEDFTQVPNEDRRTLAAGMNSLAVQMDAVVHARLGPAEPEPPFDDTAPYQAVDVEAAVTTPLED